ncbi:hypothetical protein, partial [Hydrogenophaga sp.]|uniref:hypothetical protein n=1 Tax=Hydrogenophaga sp. TaxID=1904254 RepID=UPI00273723DC
QGFGAQAHGQLRRCQGGGNQARVSSNLTHSARIGVEGQVPCKTALSHFFIMASTLYGLLLCNF